MNNKYQQQEQELSAKDYKLFSDGKTTVEVSIALNLREPEATKFYKEYWKLKRRLHKLYFAYNELGDKDIGYFVKLYKLPKKEGISV